MKEQLKKKISEESFSNKLPRICLGGLYLVLIAWFAIWAVSSE